MNKWQKTVAAALTVAAVTFLGNAWIGHFAQASEDHGSITEAQETQERLVELVEALGSRVTVEDAKIARDRELCMAGMIENRRVCAEAGIRLDR